MFFDNNSLHSLEYWSDEEGQYPAQMSLSPLPTESTYRMTTAKNPTTNTEKGPLKILGTNHDVEVLARNQCIYMFIIVVDYS